MIIEYENIGSYSVKNGEYFVTPDSSDQGVIFKNEDNYNNHPDEPCYASEACFTDENEQPDGSYKVDRADMYSYNDLLTEVGDYMSADTEKFKDTIFENNPELLTDVVFGEIDWQEPLTYLESLEFEY